jgi:hypothetical protein
MLKFLMSSGAVLMVREILFAEVPDEFRCCIDGERHFIIPPHAEVPDEFRCCIDGERIRILLGKS